MKQIFQPGPVRKLKLRFAFALVAPWVLMLLGFWWLKGPAEKVEVEYEQQVDRQKFIEQSDERKVLAQELGPYFLHSQFPKETEINWRGQKRKVTVEYSLDRELQDEADKLLHSYRPDYGSVVILDAVTGRVLAMSSYQKLDPSAPSLALRGTFPAASIFKIVTATAAVDKYRLSPETSIFFNGANYTLYKKNVMETKHNRWTREMTIREAFARSINTVFGRLTFERLQPRDLQEYANRFGFNKKIESDLPFDQGYTQIPDEKVFHLAEIASGYNKVTRMSPLQGAMIAGSVASSGKMMVPSLVDRIRDENGEILYQAEPLMAGTTMTPAAAENLRKMMGLTITKGTSTKSFRSLVKDKKFRELELGGKTGSLTGDNPRGKVDWFVGYGIGGPNSKLAIAAITVNVKNWTVKSSYLAQSLFRKHYREQYNEKSDKFFNASLEAQGH